METMLEKADVWLSAWGARNTRAFSNIDSEKIKNSRAGEKGWRKFYSGRMGDGSLRWCGTQFPTYADAQEASMSFSEYEDFVYGAGLLDHEDPVAEWNRVSKEQERWVKYLDTKKELHILTEGTDIKVSVEGRKWINCDGRVNFPDGEIFTSPVENKINGHITFSFPGIYAGKEIEGIELEVKDGKVVSYKAKKGEDLLKALLETDEGASHFGEVAIGTNYGIKKFTRNMLFDEKIGGTVHMAIGDSMPEAGGKNRSSLHWDMLCDMRNGGRIYADGELFYENGEFKKEILEREELSSTGFGNGIAIPHAKTSAVKIPRVAVGISKDGFDFDSVDGNKANLIFMIAAGDDDNDLHLKTLSHLAQNLMDDEFVKEILNSKSKKEIVQLLSR